MMWRLAFWWHGWRYRRQARHLVRVTATEWEDARPFYGSMILDDERAISPAGYFRGLSGILASTTTNLARDPDDPYDPEEDAPYGWLPAPEVAHSGWWGQTAADLAPEALAGECAGLPPPAPSAHTPQRGPASGAYLADPTIILDSGPGLSLVVPGPDTSRLAWLDRQLASHAEWARRMRGQVTGWGLEGAA